MSVTPETLNKINSLKQGIEAATGETYADLTAGVQALKDGYRQGGEAKEEQEKTVEITKNGTTKVVADEGKALSKVTVEVSVPERFDEGYSVGKQDGYNEGYSKGYKESQDSIKLQEKTVTENGTVTADNGYTGLSKVTVNVEDAGSYQEGYDRGFEESQNSIEGHVDAQAELIQQIEDALVGKSAGSGGSSDVFKKLVSGQKFSITPDDIYGVSDIGSYAFSNIAYIENVELPESVRAIDGYAFYSSGIKSIIFNEGLENILEEAFSDCRSLRTVTFKGVPMSVDANVFVDCFNLTINVPWSEGEYDDEHNGLGDIPWGASSATINYNYTGG